MGKLFSIYRFIPLLAVLLVISCKKTEIDVDALTDFPPGIISIYPSDGGKVVAGEFDVTIVFADGSISPLAEATVVLMDNAGTELGAATAALTGTEGTLVLAGSEFNAASLALGFYKMNISVTDSKGQTTTRETTFEISNLPFAANYDEMYLAGAFNGWGADAFELIADNTWFLSEVTLDGGEWKLKNCVDWCDQDWGDADCTGTVVNTTGGGPNSACSPSGLFNMTFNDDNLSYQFTPAVNFDANISGLYLLGSFNDFQGEDYEFTLVDDNTWELAEAEINEGDQYRFSEGPFFMGSNWGDDEGDGVAEEFGQNIVFDQQTAFYKFTFNDRTLEYSVEFVRFPSIGIIGSATPGGWDEDTDMTDNGDGTFSLLISLVDGEAKFRANNAWDLSWGGSDFPTGVATSDNGPNIPVTAGTYQVSFNPTTGEYDFASNLEVSMIGDATPGGWAEDTYMTNNGDGTYSLLVGLVDGQAKFRANGNWDINWGSSGFPTGTGTQDGDNIPVTAGIYNVTLNPGTGDYSFEAASIGIIGSGTPTGWDSDTDMSLEAGNEPVLIINMTLTDGEAKFRLDDLWDFSWGGSDFPSGTAELNQPTNIPVTAGTYNIRFNINTLEYSFTP